MQRLNAAWEEVSNLIIRPQRAQYDEAYLGPAMFRLGDQVFERTDIDVVNPRGLVLKCSHFQPTAAHRPSSRMPVVIYLHGNCGCRLDALECVTVLLPHGITVFALDFSGSGLSEGQYVSLGFFECQDLAAVVDHLLLTKTVSRIGFWGRSMGAVTAIMYGSRDPSVAAIVADSPFATLQQVMLELVRSYKSWIPQAATKLAIRALRSTILQRAQFPIDDLNTVAYARGCAVPLLLGHAKDDDFIRIHHSETVLAAYQGPKRLRRFDGDHNSERPADFLEEVARFFVQHLRPAPLADPLALAVPQLASPHGASGSSLSNLADSECTDHAESLASDLPAERRRDAHSTDSALLEPAPDRPEGPADPDPSRSELKWIELSFAESQAKKREEEETKRKAEEDEAAAKRKVEDMEAKKKVEEEEARKKAEDEEARKKAEEEEARKKAEEEEAKQKAKEEEEAKRKAEEEEAKKKAEEEEARKKAEEEEAKKKAEEEEARKKAEEEEAKKKAEEEEAKKKAEEEEARKKAEEEEAKKKAEEEEARKKAEEEEARKKAEEEEAKRKAEEEEEAKKKAEEEEARKKAEEEEAKKKAEEEEAKRKAEEEEARKKAEEEEARKKAAEEEKKKAEEEEAKKKAEEEEARKKAEEEEAKKKAEEEEARKKAEEEEAKKKAEEEEARKKAEEEEARKKAEEEEAKKKAEEEEARKKAEEQDAKRKAEEEEEAKRKAEEEEAKKKAEEEETKKKVEEEEAKRNEEDAGKVSEEEEAREITEEEERKLSGEVDVVEEENPDAQPAQ